jgi:hypothetical protein
LGGDYTTPVEGGQLAFWNTTGEEEGLYTLQLTVVRGDQSLERQAVQVTIDNTPPRVEFINPEPDTVYEYVPDPLLNDWINFQADASDNFSMNRVEYFLDNQKVGESTVAPYTLRWNVNLSQASVKWEPPVYETRVITQTDGSVITERITLTHVITVTQPITDPAELAALPPGSLPEKFIGYQKVFSNGLTLINTSLGYSQTHQLHVVAHDSAGNETKSEPVRVVIIPKPKEQDKNEEDEGDGDGAYLIPAMTGDETALLRHREGPVTIRPGGDRGG